MGEAKNSIVVSLNELDEISKSQNTLINSLKEWILNKGHSRIEADKEEIPDTQKVFDQIEEMLRVYSEKTEKASFLHNDVTEFWSKQVVEMKKVVMQRDELIQKLKDEISQLQAIKIRKQKKKENDGKDEKALKEKEKQIENQMRLIEEQKLQISDLKGSLRDSKERSLIRELSRTDTPEDNEIKQQMMAKQSEHAMEKAQFELILSQQNQKIENLLHQLEQARKDLTQQRTKNESLYSKIQSKDKELQEKDILVQKYIKLASVEKDKILQSNPVPSPLNQEDRYAQLLEIQSKMNDLEAKHEADLQRQAELLEVKFQKEKQNILDAIKSPENKTLLTSIVKEYDTKLEKVKEEHSAEIENVKKIMNGKISVLMKQYEHRIKNMNMQHESELINLKNVEQYEVKKNELEMEAKFESDMLTFTNSKQSEIDELTAKLHALEDQNFLFQKQNEMFRHVIQQVDPENNILDEEVVDNADNVNLFDTNDQQQEKLMKRMIERSHVIKTEMEEQHKWEIENLRRTYDKELEKKKYELQIAARDALVEVQTKVDESEAKFDPVFIQDTITNAIIALNDQINSKGEDDSEHEDMISSTEAFIRTNKLSEKVSLLTNMNHDLNDKIKDMEKSTGGLNEQLEKLKVRNEFLESTKTDDQDVMLAKLDQIQKEFDDQLKFKDNVIQELQNAIFLQQEKPMTLYTIPIFSVVPEETPQKPTPPEAPAEQHNEYEYEYDYEEEEEKHEPEQQKEPEPEPEPEPVQVKEEEEKHEEPEPVQEPVLEPVPEPEPEPEPVKEEEEKHEEEKPKEEEEKHEEPPVEVKKEPLPQKTSARKSSRVKKRIKGRSKTCLQIEPAEIKIVTEVKEPPKQEVETREIPVQTSKEKVEIEPHPIPATRSLGNEKFQNEFKKSLPKIPNNVVLVSVETQASLVEEQSCYETEQEPEPDPYKPQLVVEHADSFSINGGKADFKINIIPDRPPRPQSSSSARVVKPRRFIKLRYSPMILLHRPELIVEVKQTKPVIQRPFENSQYLMFTFENCSFEGVEKKEATVQVDDPVPDQLKEKIDSLRMEIATREARLEELLGHLREGDEKNRILQEMAEAEKKRADEYKEKEEELLEKERNLLLQQEFSKAFPPYSKSRDDILSMTQQQFNNITPKKPVIPLAKDPSIPRIDPNAKDYTKVFRSPSLTNDEMSVKTTPRSESSKEQSQVQTPVQETKSTPVYKDRLRIQMVAPQEEEIPDVKSTEDPFGDSIQLIAKAIRYTMQMNESQNIISGTLESDSEGYESYLIATNKLEDNSKTFIANIHDVINNMDKFKATFNTQANILNSLLYLIQRSRKNFNVVLTQMKEVKERHENMKLEEHRKTLEELNVKTNIEKGEVLNKIHAALYTVNNLGIDLNAQDMLTYESLTKKCDTYLQNQSIDQSLVDKLLVDTQTFISSVKRSNIKETEIMTLNSMSELKRVKKQLKKAQDTISRLQRDVEHQKDIVLSSEIEQNSLKNRIEQERKQHDEHISLYHAQIETLHDLFDQINGSQGQTGFKNIQQMAQNIKSQVISLQALLDTSMSDQKAAEARAFDLEQVLSKKEKELIENRKELEEAKYKQSDLEAKVAQNRYNVLFHDAEVEKLKRENKGEQDAKKQLQKEISVLSKENVDLRNRIEELESENTFLKQTMSHLETDVESDEIEKEIYKLLEPEQKVNIMTQTGQEIMEHFNSPRSVVNESTETLNLTGNSSETEDKAKTDTESNETETENDEDDNIPVKGHNEEVANLDLMHIKQDNKSADSLLTNPSDISSPEEQTNLPIKLSSRSQVVFSSKSSLPVPKKTTPKDYIVQMQKLKVFPMNEIPTSRSINTPHHVTLPKNVPQMQMRQSQGSNFPSKHVPTTNSINRPNLGKLQPLPDLPLVQGTHYNIPRRANETPMSRPKTAASVGAVQRQMSRSVQPMLETETIRITNINFPPSAKMTNTFSNTVPGKNSPALLSQKQTVPLVAPISFENHETTAPFLVKETEMIMKKDNNAKEFLAKLQRLKQKTKDILEQSEKKDELIKDLRAKIKDLSTQLQNARIENLKAKEESRKSSVRAADTSQRLELSMAEIGRMIEEANVLRKEVYKYKAYLGPIDSSISRYRTAHQQKKIVTRQRNFETNVIEETRKSLAKAANDATKRHLMTMLENHRESQARLEAKRRMWEEQEKKQITATLEAMFLIDTSEPLPVISLPFKGTFVSKPKTKRVPLPFVDNGNGDIEENGDVKEIDLSVNNTATI